MERGRETRHNPGPTRKQFGEKQSKAVATRRRKQDHTVLEHNDGKGREKCVGEHPPDLISLAI